MKGLTRVSRYYLVFKALTFTYKAKNVLKFRYPKLKIVPTPKDLNSSGCKYAILIEGNIDNILEILRNNNVPLLDHFEE